ncbi:phage tail assembly protein [Shewanella sp. M16]|uniref:phage tail assembly protein n=1 Tax=Shewanella sp. M16 TaxID=2830837 RepID=UPI001BB06340|nr:phage tail assembly protein [Shewanella sp. M16]MBS0044502.1 phage tail assembly protein [Shewanella sp. M16]QYW06283.1 tail assembly protein [Shewanella phage vB_SspM_MuM16-2]
MAVMTFDLEHGLKVGETVNLEVGLKELETTDYIDAQLAAEKVIIQDGKAICYTSDVMYGLELLMRQVEYIGKVQGPINIKELRKLHPDDFKLLHAKVSELDQLIMQELAERGRP